MGACGAGAGPAAGTGVAVSSLVSIPVARVITVLASPVAPPAAPMALALLVSPPVGPFPVPVPAAPASLRPVAVRVRRRAHLVVRLRVPVVGVDLVRGPVGGAGGLAGGLRRGLGRRRRGRRLRGLHPPHVGALALLEPRLLRAGLHVQLLVVHVRRGRAVGLGDDVMVLGGGDGGLRLRVVLVHGHRRRGRGVHRGGELGVGVRLRRDGRNHVVGSGDSQVWRIQFRVLEEVKATATAHLRYHIVGSQRGVRRAAEERVAVDLGGRGGGGAQVGQGLRR